MNKNTDVKCPNCEKKFNYYKSEFRPFCCERCQMIDLGQWFNGSYTVPSKEQLNDEDIETVLKELKENDE